MDAMDQLFDLYNRHIDDLEDCGEQLNAMYPEPADHSVRRKSRQQFEAFVLGPQHEAKREYIARLVTGQEELVERLPSPVREFVRRAA